MKTKFEDCFPYDKTELYGVVLFFDNLVKRDFFKKLKLMKDCHSSMISESIGYNLPEDSEDKGADYIELWWYTTKEHSYNISFEMFIECLKIAAQIWIKNNNISKDSEIALEIKECINTIKQRYNAENC